MKSEAPPPGAYNDPRSALESLKKVTGLKHSPFGQTSVRFDRDRRAGEAPGACFRFASSLLIFMLNMVDFS